MGKHQGREIDQYILNSEFYKSMRVDLLRAILLGFISTIILAVLIIYAYNYDHGLHGIAYLFSGLVGLLIVLYKPGRPAQINRNTFGFPKEYSEYEKKLEVVMLHLRKRRYVIIANLPYFVWLLYIIYTKDFPNRINVEMIFASSFMSFLTILIFASSVQYFQIWYSLSKLRNRLKG